MFIRKIQKLKFTMKRKNVYQKNTIIAIYNVNQKNTIIAIYNVNQKNTIIAIYNVY